MKKYFFFLVILTLTACSTNPAYEQRGEEPSPVFVYYGDREGNLYLFCEADDTRKWNSSWSVSCRIGGGVEAQYLRRETMVESSRLLQGELVLSNTPMFE